MRSALLEHDRVNDRFGFDLNPAASEVAQRLVDPRLKALEFRFVSAPRALADGRNGRLDREMRGIARIIGFIFATGTLVAAVAAIFAGVVWKYEQDLPITLY